MDIEAIREYCLKKSAVTEGFPFDEDTLVFKVEGKIFALLNLKRPNSINLKCDPEEALRLRELHKEVVPGYHMNKKHWNTVHLLGTLKIQLLLQMIDNSYGLVVHGLPKKIRDKIEL